jgi:hypothetical protein
MKRFTSKHLTSLLMLAFFAMSLFAYSGNPGNVKVHESNISDLLAEASSAGTNTIIVLTDNNGNNVDAAMELAVGTAAIANLHVAVLNRDLAENKQLISDLQLARFPSPYVLILAPSGIVAGGVVPGRVPPERFAAFVPGELYNRALNARKEGKPCYIMVYDEENEEYADWMKTVDESSSILDPKPEIITIHYADETEATFLSRIGYREGTTFPQLFVLNPAGQTTGKFDKTPTALEINAAAKKMVSSGCASKCSSASSCDSKSKQGCE